MEKITGTTTTSNFTLHDQSSCCVANCSFCRPVDVCPCCGQEVPKCPSCGQPKRLAPYYPTAPYYPNPYIPYPWQPYNPWTVTYGTTTGGTT